MDNLIIYNAVREVPKEAQKSIGGGRLKGMTDINPMWRIKALTEQFGACGIGWYYEIKRTWVETCMAKDEITANVEIDLFYKWKGEWSKPIPGIGGSMLVANEKGGLYVNDECYKMALTDAISVACKALGVGADIYWAKDTTKYNDTKRDNFKQEKEAEAAINDELDLPATNLEKKSILDYCAKLGYESSELFAFIGFQAGKETFTKRHHAKCMQVLMEMENKNDKA
jgi:hypothetical protein